jgi:stearoyl-CoA desaturase (delta-9 desaturase)
MVGAYWPKIARIFAAVHRKHHAMPDTLDDPHTPWIYSCRELLFPTTDREKGKAYYMPPEERDSIAGDVPAFDDKLDIFLMKYLPYSKIPLVLVFLTLFSWQGAIIGFVWLTISRYSGRLHNCVSHKYGYRWQPAKTEGDRSVNCLPIGLVFGGEELGANHHDYPDLVNFAIKWYEFDTGWYVVKVLEFFKLVKIVKS